MTGARFDVKVDDSELRAGLSALRDRVGNLTPAMDEIGKTISDHTKLRFERQRDPQGQPWRPHAAATVLRRARRRGGQGFAAKAPGAAQILLDSGRLRNSITHFASPDRVEVGTNTIYAAIHQFGGQAGRGHATTIPARPFLGLDEADRADIPEIVARHLREVLP